MKSPKADQNDRSDKSLRQRELAPEEFPEGSYSASRDARESLSGNDEGKDSSRSSAKRFGYTDETLHHGLARQYPGEDVSEADFKSNR